MNKNIKFGLIIILILVAMFFTAKGLGLGAVTSTSGEKVTYYSPDFVQYDCAIVDANKVGETVTDFAYKEGEYTTIKCNEFTKGCTFKLDRTPEYKELGGSICGGGAVFDVQICDANGNNCVVDMLPLLSGKTIASNQVLKVNTYYQSGFLCLTRNKVPTGVMSITKIFDQYGLITTGDTFLDKVPGSCDLAKLSRNYLSNIATSVNGKVEGSYKTYSQGEVPSKLIFTEIGNRISYISYINEWNPVSTESVYNYKGKEVYCAAPNKLYEFGEITTADGAEKRLAPTIAVDAPEVECCPFQDGCTKDFKFEITKIEDVECISDAQCGEGRYYPTGSKEVQIQKCVDKHCVVSNTKPVECSLQSDCKGAGSVCDTNTWTCKQGDVPVCNNNKTCDLGETVLTCPNDCTALNTNDKEEEKFNTQKFLMFVMIGIIAGLYAFAKTEYDGTKKQKLIFKWVSAIVIGTTVFIGLPYLINIFAATLTFVFSIVLIALGMIGLWFVNTTLPNSKFKFVANIILAAIIILGTYGLFIAIGKFSIASIFGGA